MKFRTDINGLRTYAVMAVLIFHFNKEWLPGGFAGVDIFFVISGFLMTSIIFRGFENNTFSLLKFFSARIRRIIPALLVLVILLLIFGYLFLPPIPYEELSKHSGGSLLFISNFMYWKESGYFDTSAINKFLLHTWSLSVEWQFYILYPIVLICLSKVFKVTTLKRVIVYLTVISFGLATYFSFSYPVASYFLLPSRSWEMLLGGIAYLYPINISKKRTKLVLEWTGLLLILCAFFIISENTVWPGYMALLPTIGAFILIQANHQHSFITNNPLAQKIGLWSYSLYLYHWPILVINHKFSLDLNIGLFLLITFVFSLISYYFIEIKRWKVTHILIALLAISIPISVVDKTNGANFRVDPKYILNSLEFHEKYYGGHGYPAFEKNHLGEQTPSDHKTLIFGDSFAWQYAKYIDENQSNIVSFFADGCMMLPNYGSAYREEDCRNTSNDLFAQASHLNDYDIIWSQAWDGHAELISKNNQQRILKGIDKSVFLKTLENEIDLAIKRFSNNTIYIISPPSPPTYNIFECLAAQQLMGNSECDEYIERKDPEINAFLHSVSEKYDNVFIIDANEALCENNQCKMIINGEPAFSDMGHLSVYGADIVGAYIFQRIKELKNAQVDPRKI